MDSSIFYGVAGAVVGMLVGWLIASLRIQQQRLTLEGDLRLHQQEIAQYQQEQQTLIQQRQQQELQQREKDQELRMLHSQLAATQEKLNQQSVWRNECEQLNQELRALREVNSAQEAELREVTIRLEETRLGAEEKQRLLVNSEQRLSAQFENLANRILNIAENGLRSRIAKV